ncbi:hypothetical protein KCU91_g2726, partial [Aureobasidium melanogenum]
MPDHNKIPRPKTPEGQRFSNSDDKETKPADDEHVKDQANDHNSTTITRPVNLPLRTTTTKPLAPSLLSPFDPSDIELVGHDHIRLQVPAEPVARGPEFEHRAWRAMETTMHLAQIVKLSTMVVAREDQESDEGTFVAEHNAQKECGTEEGQGVEEDEEREMKKIWLNSEDVAEHHKYMMFERGLEILDEESSDAAVTASGSEEHSTLDRPNDPHHFTSPCQAVNTPVSRSTCYSERHLDIQSAPASTKKMSKELRRLTIDANPSLGGAAASSSSSASAAKRGTRRSGMRQELLADETQSLPDTAPLHLLSDGRVLLTPSPSDSPNSPHVAVVPERVPTPPPVTQPQTSNAQPQSSTESPALTAKSAGKRKITQYFTAVPQQPKNNKRRKLDHDHLDPPALQNTVSAPEPPVAAPATLQTAASAPELKSDANQESEQNTSNHVEESVVHNVAQAIHVPQQDKEPDKPHDTDQEQLYVTAEEGHDQEDAKKKEEEEKKALKRERELKRLQIDAKPALTDKRSRRQTTLPPARPDDQDSRPAKRQRLSLPAPAVAGSSSAAAHSAQEPDKVAEEVVEEAPDANSIAQALAVPPEPNPPVFPAGTDPKLLASGEVNDEWLTKWLGYVAHITGDEDTSKILTEEDAKELIKPDRSDETQQDRQKRISNELDMVAGWNVVEQQQEAVQSSPEPEPAPVKPPVKKKKQRFNPKPKGQPYIPKAKRKAQELAAKKLAKKKAEAEAAEAKLAQEAQEAQEATTNEAPAEKETEAAPEPTPEQPAAVQDTDAPTDWLTDLMNATEPIVPEEEQAKKTKKSAKGKAKAKVV